jgi:hypothetical protein
MKKKVIVWSIVIILMIIVTAIVGSGFYMLDYSLGPNPNRTDTAASFRRQFNVYPETQPWVDSLRSINALRDTFIIMPTGERHHALYVWKGSNKTALILHGWRDSSIGLLFLARLYEHELGYNVVMPDLHAHGLSEGDIIQMGWLDRKDALHWLSTFRTDTMAVHGVSMGGATTMMLSAEDMPKGIKDIRFIDDCGYTSVWDEFTGELKNQFGLPEFPLMYTSSLLCKLRYGWSFGEASALNAVRQSPYPMLFIHGSNDTFVPTEMVYRLYEAKQPPKELWIAEGAIHAESYLKYREEYTQHVKDFLINTTAGQMQTESHRR